MCLIGYWRISGSAVAVGAKLVDFSLGESFKNNFCLSWLVLNRLLNQKVLAIIGTDTRASVRVPASYCGILGFQPSHDAVCTAGVIPLVQSFESVGKEQTNLCLLSQIVCYIEM